MTIPKNFWVSPLQHTVSQDTFLFEERNGVYYLGGEKLKQMLTSLGEPHYADVVGFEPSVFMLYAKQLLEMGAKVGVARGNVVQMLLKDSPIPHPQVKSKAIWLSPELLVGRRELVRLAVSKAVRTPAMQELIATLKEHLIKDDINKLAGYGTFYVFQVAQDMYEVDSELTTMPSQVLEAFLVASHQVGRMLRCQLVEPRGRRQNHRLPHRSTQVSVTEPTTYGQLRLGL